MTEAINPKDKIFVIVCAAGSAVAMATFGVFRFVQKDYEIAFLDMALMAMFFCFAVCAVFENRLNFARLGLATSFVIGTIIHTWMSPESGSSWVFVIILAVYVVLFSPRRALAMTTVLILITGLLLFFLDSQHSIDQITFLMQSASISAFAFFYTSRNANAQKWLSKLSLTDSLTEIGNRRAFVEKINQVVNLNERTPKQAYLFYLDVDSFKEINDNLGHAEGVRIFANCEHRFLSSVNI
jgi:predicted signal transduction protein with EAL and GGDEF domain